MDLESVLELQHDLIERRVNRPAEREGEVRVFSTQEHVEGAGVFRLREPEPRIALGVTGSEGRYRLAVRVVALTPATRERVAQIVEEAGDDVETEVIGEVSWQSNPVVGGPIARKGSAPGTLGAVVRDLADGAPRLLSAAHVLAPPTGGPATAPVCVPDFQLGYGACSAVGALQRSTPFDPAATNWLDAAVARVDSGTPLPANDLRGLGSVAGVRAAALAQRTRVAKVGFGSGLRWGVVSCWWLNDLSCRTPVGRVYYSGQIEIRPEASEPFSTQGDSGSLVVDEALQAVGLLFAGNGFDRSYANPIADALAALGCSLP